MELLREWRNIPLEWAENYEVSNYGEIRNKKNNKIRRLIKDDNGYYNSIIIYNGKAHQLYAHRAVALAFIPNDDPEHKICVSHLDETRDNNRIDNLEWATPKENMNMPNLLAMRKTGRTPFCKINQYDLKGNLLNTYKSIAEASREVGLGSSSIHKALNGARLTSGGFIWKYADQEDENENTESNNG